MILTCPSCGTQYAVKDGAIPPEGRKVRCAACGHSWQQGGEVTEVAPLPAPEEEIASPGAEPGYEPGEQGETGIAQPTVESVAPAAPLVEPPGSVPVPPPDAEQWGTQSSDESSEEITNEIPTEEEIAAAEAETAPRHRRSVLLGVLIALLVVAIIAIAAWFLAPDSIRRGLGLAALAPPALQISAGTPERQKLASGNELVVVSGRIINPGSNVQPVPPIKAQLRDRTGRLVYSWTIEPPATRLPPGGSASFNSAEVDVPPSGPNSTVTFSLNS